MNVVVREIIAIGSDCELCVLKLIRNTCCNRL